jgi:hypothetical protein
VDSLCCFGFSFDAPESALQEHALMRCPRPSLYYIQLQTIFSEQVVQVFQASTGNLKILQTSLVITECEDLPPCIKQVLKKTIGATISLHMIGTSEMTDLLCV